MCPTPQQRKRQIYVSHDFYTFYIIQVIINYLCTYELYGPVRNAFDAGTIDYLGKWEGVGPWKSRVFWALNRSARAAQVHKVT